MNFMYSTDCGKLIESVIVWKFGVHASDWMLLKANENKLCVLLIKCPSLMEFELTQSENFWCQYGM